MKNLKRIKHLLQMIVSITKEEQKIPIISRVENSELLDGRVALITGGSGGIGEVIAKKLVNSGCKVIIAGTNEEKLISCLERCGAHKTIVINMNNIEQFEEKIEEAASFFGKIDILVHSAGIHTKRENLDFINITENLNLRRLTWSFHLLMKTM